MEIVYKKLEDLKPYNNNPRFNDEAVKYVANSIKEFGFKVPMVIDKDGTIVAGHTRYKASIELGLKEVPCIIADDLSEEQIKAFRLADNKVSEKSKWNFDLLEEELNDILNIDMSEFDFDVDFDIDDVEQSTQNLNDKFIVPPFSILDTRQGYWQERKNQWKQLGIKSEIGRDENLMDSPDIPDYANYSKNVLKGVAPQTSIFDPVLCEIMYKWFNIESGKILDPFAGGSVRGIVAEYLGYKYYGIDLRQEQIDANIENAKEIGVEPKWFCDDSQNVDKYIDDNSVDMIFSCPPYFDLEKYSDNEKDLSNMEYEDFKTIYKKIISKCCNKLKNDRFAVFVVGDIRDNNGAYRNFIELTKEAFLENGLVTYNEAILVEQIGTGAMRVNHTFSNGRKLIKTHQNCLIFYKGDIKKIKNNYKEIKVEDIDIGEENI